MVYIEDSVFEGLCKPWQDALVVKLLDKHIGYNIMKDKLSRIWKLKVGFDMIDIGNDFFVVKLNLDEDRKKIIENGPWMIFDHYLIIQTWTLAFVSPSTMIDPTMVWIRFPGLNLYFYDESILLAGCSIPFFVNKTQSIQLINRDILVQFSHFLHHVFTFSLPLKFVLPSSSSKTLSFFHIHSNLSQ